jgi:UDP-2-acetamido-3-amino-2,3-dideoxy-glucuronate N-acetyltransferase
MQNAVIGNRCSIGQNVVISPGCSIGDGCKIQNNVSVYTGVTVEADVFLGPSVVFTNVINPRAFIERKAEPTTVRRGATLGANSTIVCGIELGEYCFVGAGAVVTRDVPAYATVYGNPARTKGYVCWCGSQLRSAVSPAVDTVLACVACQRQYQRSGAVIRPLVG